MRKSLVIPAVMVMLGTAALLGAAPAVAGTTTTQVNISPQAQMAASVLPGLNTIAVSVTFTCSGGTGTVSLTATQTSAQSNSGSSASGSGSVSAKCDGKSHKVTQFLRGGGFQQGTATVSATLTAPSGTATDEKVVQVNQP